MCDHAGSSDGSITLWSSPSHTLCTAADVSCWQPCATVNPPDSLAVTCIDLVWTEPSEPGQPTHLLVCAGKTCGSVFVWRSGPVTLSHSTQQTGQGLQAALKAGASSWLTRGVHGLHSVSGISIQPWQCGVEGTQGGWQLLSSTATDGEVRCFKISSTGMEVRRNTDDHTRATMGYLPWFIRTETHVCLGRSSHALCTCVCMCMSAPYLQACGSPCRFNPCLVCVCVSVCLYRHVAVRVGSILPLPTTHQSQL